MAPQDEPALIRALQNAARYPHPVAGIELIETHISWVLLTGTYAYKLKKPVNLGFLDFTAPERRRHFCEEELRLNRRLAPTLYLGLVRICGPEHAPVLDGPGPVLEYAVKMRQFDPSAQFDRLLAAGRLGEELIERLAAVLARFHASAERMRADDPYGEAQSIIGPARDNFAAITLPPAFAAERRALATLAAWTEAAWTRLAPGCARRKADGRVRECHGDLHLANITLHEGEPTPFDCLEFDPGLSRIDVMSEVAFLTMDLDAHDRPDLAHAFLNAYLHHTGDYEGLAVLRFYQVYRAMVRAKIASIRASQRGAGADDDWRALSRYIALAEGYARGRRGALIIAHGLSGSGKTTLSHRLLAPCRLIRIRSDVERKRLAGHAAEARTRSGVGGGIYTPEAGERTYRRLEALAEIAVTAGFNVLVDATFLRAAEREAFRALAARLDAAFMILHFDAPEEILRQRIRQRLAGGSDASEADTAVLTHQLATQDPLTEDELSRAVRVDTSREPDIAAIAGELDKRKVKS